jgi:Ca2+-binding EF-hand superfamily protein
VFRRIDTNNNGVINEQQFHSLLSDLTLFPGPYESDHINQLMVQVDPGNNQRVTYSQIVKLLSMEVARFENRDIPIMQKIFLAHEKKPFQ